MMPAAASGPPVVEPSPWLARMIREYREALADPAGAVRTAPPGELSSTPIERARMNVEGALIREQIARARRGERATPVAYRLDGRTWGIVLLRERIEWKSSPTGFRTRMRETFGVIDDPT